MKHWLFGLLACGLLTAPVFGAVVPPADGVPPNFWHLPPGSLPVLYGASQPGETLTPAYDSQAARGATYLGPAHMGWLGVDLVMHMRDEGGLERYAALASNPHSRYYRHFLTPERIGDLFGVSAAEYARTVRYFWANGLEVRWWKQREMLSIVGPQENLEHALSTKLGWFRKDNVTFYAPRSVPHFGVPLPVDGVAGIVNFRRMRDHMRIERLPQPLIGWGPGFLTGNSPFDLAAAFDYTGGYGMSPSCCKGNGITIAIVGTGSISDDAAVFKQLFNVGGSSAVTQINVTNAVFNPLPNGSPPPIACCYSEGLQTPPPVSTTLCEPYPGGLPTCNPEDGEAQLDTEQTTSLAPSVDVLFYLAYNPNECYSPGVCPPGTGTPELGVNEADDELQQIANDNKADIVSGSYGIGELDWAGNSGGLLNADGTGAEPAIFASLAAEGIAVFFSSGDSGAESCQPDFPPGVSPNADLLCVAYPADDPNVVSVGGTTTPIGSNGRLTGLITTWGVQTQSGGAGGGGFSSVFARPAYQPSGKFCANKPDTSGNQCDSTHRLQPDLSLNADPETADALVCGAGFNGRGVNCLNILIGPALGSVGGTSAASQGMAAMWSLILEACKQTAGCGGGYANPYSYRLGNPAPLLYDIYAGNDVGGLPYNAAFYNVTYGLNAVPNSTGPGYSDLDPGFEAGTGYNLATGLGAPFGANLIKAITNL
jgi:subtilase family serine protease